MSHERSPSRRDSVVDRRHIPRDGYDELLGVDMQVWDRLGLVTVVEHDSAEGRQILGAMFRSVATCGRS